MKKRISFAAKTALTLFIVMTGVQGLGLIFYFSFMRGGSSDNMLPFLLVYQIFILIAVISSAVILVNKNIKKPLAEIKISLAKADKGGLTVHMDNAGCLEIAELNDSINSLAEQFRRIMGQFFSNIKNLTMEIRQTEKVMRGILETVNMQLSGTDAVISSFRDTDEQKKLILETTRNLSEFSEDNVSSITEINASVNEITDRTKELFRSSNSAYFAVAEMSEAAKTLSVNTENLSVSTEQTTASVEEMAGNIKEIEKGTRESANLTDKLRELASGVGMISVADAMEGMESIAASVAKSRDLVKGLKAKSLDIEMVISVIADINKKTNLLSLNAAILASQAGEHGKGFSVVADEIKMLADETAASAKNIIAIIESTQKDIAAALKVTEESLEIVDSGNSLVVNTGEAFREVIDIARNSSDTAKKIQHATEEQVAGVTQISRTMEVLWGIVDNVAKATNKQEKGSESLMNLSEDIKRISEDIKRGMEEQNKGINMISKNLEIENDKIRHITDAASNQIGTDKELLLAMENIKKTGKNLHDDSEEMRASFKRCLEEAETLLNRMKGFGLE
ncbi:MAG: HAMP domain-containing methyl-accepting chemotaxis protein [Nitrospirota bacterium]